MHLMVKLCFAALVFFKHLLDYKNVSANVKNAVIPAWMQESRAREGDYPWQPYPI